MKSRRTARSPRFFRRQPADPQLALRLEITTPVTEARWEQGMTFAYLGRQLSLQLDTPCDVPTLQENVLHLPLPPAAVARQIQDALEAWLRQEARRVIEALLLNNAQRLACEVPAWAFSFAALADWVQQHDDGSLRFNWRLIEQPQDFIEQRVSTALEQMCGAGVTADLWSQSEP